MDTYLCYFSWTQFSGKWKYPQKLIHLLQVLGLHSNVHRISLIASFTFRIIHMPRSDLIVKEFNLVEINVLFSVELLINFLSFSFQTGHQTIPA